VTALAHLLAALLAATPAAPDAPGVAADAPAAPEAPDAAAKPADPARRTAGPNADAAPLAPSAVAGPPEAHARTWFALPVLFWLPETKLGYGATGGLHQYVGGASRPSSVFGAAVYTLERQGSVDVAADVYVPSGALFSGRVRAIHFPDAFYGVGPGTRLAQKEAFTRRYVEAVVTWELPLPRWPAVRAGPRLDLRAEEITDVVAGGALASGAITGADGYSAASAGASVTYDTRDGPFWPSGGALAQAWYVYAPEALGRHRAFGRGVLELRRFLPLGGGRTLGLHAYAEGVHGDPPFTLLPKLGSTRFLRGIREGRYRDRLDWATQAELRVPVRGRLSAVAFGAIGDVAPSVRALTLAHPKVAGGAGLRIRLTDAGANIRIDGAISDAGPELYVLVLEAF
jgi:hypothetical protein